MLADGSALAGRHRRRGWVDEQEHAHWAGRVSVLPVGRLALARTLLMVVVRSRDLDALAREISGCAACPRLVEWREQVGREKRAAFRDERLLGPAGAGLR